MEAAFFSWVVSETTTLSCLNDALIPLRNELTLSTTPPVAPRTTESLTTLTTGDSFARTSTGGDDLLVEDQSPFLPLAREILRTCRSVGLLVFLDRDAGSGCSWFCSQNIPPSLNIAEYNATQNTRYPIPCYLFCNFCPQVFCTHCGVTTHCGSWSVELLNPELYYSWLRSISFYFCFK